MQSDSDSYYREVEDVSIHDLETNETLESANIVRIRVSNVEVFVLIPLGSLIKVKKLALTTMSRRNILCRVSGKVNTIAASH